jgi:predicted PurR-regulated permease PerM
VQSTNGHFLPAIITLFSTLALVPILVVVFGLIIRRRKELIKKRRTKNENEWTEIINANEENSYEMVNYYEINENDSKIESNTNKTVKYLEIIE